MSYYYQPLLQTGFERTNHALRLAGGLFWFDCVVVIERGRRHAPMPISEVPSGVLDRLIAPRAQVAGLKMDKPHLMGVLNVTPDSFSDGGQFEAPETAVARARQMAEQGATLLDIGGESTRPGADYVEPEREAARILPVITALRAGGVKTPISVDTRKAEVARAALGAGAQVVNDVSALGHDPRMAEVVAKSDAPVCLMHALGDPKTMQDEPRYEDVVLDVYDYLAAQIEKAETQGVRRERIIVDPGIGFGKTLEHNLALLRSLSLFHGLGCPVLLGVSRKRFIGTLSGVEDSGARVMGSVAIGLEGLRQGVQLLRAHDIEAHAQALACWQVMMTDS